MPYTGTSKGDDRMGQANRILLTLDRRVFRSLRSQHPGRIQAHDPAGRQVAGDPYHQ
jgi:hypothetical protein